MQIHRVTIPNDVPDWHYEVTATNLCLPVGNKYSPPETEFQDSEDEVIHNLMGQFISVPNLANTYENAHVYISSRKERPHIKSYLVVAAPVELQLRPM